MERDQAYFDLNQSMSIFNSNIMKQKVRLNYEQLSCLKQTFNQNLIYTVANDDSELQYCLIRMKERVESNEYVEGRQDVMWEIEGITGTWNKTISRLNRIINKKFEYAGLSY